MSTQFRSGPRLSSALIALALIAAGRVNAQIGTATIEIRVVALGGAPVSGATLHLRPTENVGLAWSSQARDATGPATLLNVPAGTYRATVEAAGFSPAASEIRVGPGEVQTFIAALAPAGGLAGEFSRIRLADRYRPAYGTALGDDRLRDLPSSRNVWSLIETADPLAIVDRMDNGGISSGEPGLIGIHGSSWTQTSFRLGDLDITDPDQTGTPLLYPDFDALQAIDVPSGLTPVEVGAPGPAVTLIPRRPGGTWRGSVQGYVTTRRLQSNNAQPGLPSIARFGSWGDGNFLVSGPVVKDRLGLLVSGTLTRWRRVEGADPTELKGDLGSILAHLVFTPNARDEIRVLATGQAVTHPFAGRARFSNRDVRQNDSFWHLQSTWERRAAAATRWLVTGGYQRGVFTPLIGFPPPLNGTVDRLRDGPVPQLVFPSYKLAQRWDASAQVSPPLPRLAGGKHAVRFGISLGRASSATQPLLARGTVAELVNGLPARIWDYGYLGPESRWHATEFAAYGADRITLTDRIMVEAGLRFESSSGSAEGAANEITWRTLSPRVSARWRLTESGRLVAFGGYGRYRHRLPLSYFMFGDPAGPAGFVYRWNDTDGDRLLQARELGPLIATLGPGRGSPVRPVASIDPGLKAPRTDEFVVGIERRIGDTLIGRFVGLDRREHHLVAPLNVGVTSADYEMTFVPDRGENFLDPSDDRLLPIYNRNPSSFGRDRYLLTNPAGHTTLYQGLELTVEKTFSRHFQTLFGATAYRSEGMGGNRGFRVRENDQGVLGELFDNPNAKTYARGRLFFDRGFVIKWSGSYLAPRDTRVGIVARYQDGQPFARLVIAQDLNQGPETIQAYVRGRSRFAYTLTVDARLEKGFAARGRRVAAILEAFNLLNTAKEVEEDTVTLPAFRARAAVQPPRALRLGLRVDF